MERPVAEIPFSLVRHEDRLVWIFGSSRSGSTWLLRMLSELDGAVPIDDPHLGHHLGLWRPIPLAWAAADGEPDLTTLLEIKRHKPDYFFSDRYRDAWAPALKDLITRRFEAQARDVLDGRRTDRRPLVVVKEPGSHVADLLLSLFPESRMIFLLRDGRDVVDSWLDAHRAGSWAVREGAFPVAPEGREALVRWQSAVWTYRTEIVQRAYESHPDTQRVLVRYEELLADPAAQLQRICRVVGERIDRSGLDRIAQVHDYDSVPRTEKGAGKEIREARPGSWRRHMTPAEQRAMQEIMGPKLAELGYLARFATRAA
jgi:hypothetical protein